jgi:hypothetical protein
MVDHNVDDEIKISFMGREITLTHWSGTTSDGLRFTVSPKDDDSKVRFCDHEMQD